LGHEVRGPSRDWVWWRLDGWRAVRPRCREGEWREEPSLANAAVFFFKNSLMYFGFRARYGEFLTSMCFCVTHLHEFSHISNLSSEYYTCNIMSFNLHYYVV